MSWLQWIAQRSKTTTTTPVSTLGSEPKDPFLELLNPSQLKYPGPAITHQTSADLKLTSTTLSSTTSTSTTTTSEMTTAKSEPGTWSWWTPGENKNESF